MQRVKIPRVSEPTPLGRLLRQRRRKNHVSWKRLSAKVGVEPETMMMWERGVTRDPPISKVFLYALEVGISLEELRAVVLANELDADESVRLRAEAALQEAAELSAEARERIGRGEAPEEKRPPAG